MPPILPDPVDLTVQPSGTPEPTRGRAPRAPSGDRGDQRRSARAARRRALRRRRNRRLAATAATVLAFTGGLFGAGVLADAGVAPFGPVGSSSLVAGAAPEVGPETAVRADEPAPTTAGPTDASATPSPVRPVHAPSRMLQRMSLTVEDGAEAVAGAGEPVWEGKAVPEGLTEADLVDGLLRPEIPEQGTGQLVTVPGASAPTSAVDGAPGVVRSVRVEVEEGLAVDGEVFADRVMAILTAPGGWTTHGDLAFARTDGPADITVVLASPTTTDRLCAPLRTRGEYSCGTSGRAVLNMRRWVDGQGRDEFPDRSAYREYLVNHEVGHLLGHRHERCSGTGAVAPLMQQQSYTSAPCVPNGWPYPSAR